MTALLTSQTWVPPAGRRGRGASGNESGRFERLKRLRDDDGWGHADKAPAPLRTHVTADASRRVITRNRSPDIPFDQSINAYRGCEHGCVYCYARPTHAWLGLSPGLDFESRLYAKFDAAKQLRSELARPDYVPSVIALGTNTDPYQPIEARFAITRAILEILAECRHPVSIVTKSPLVTRDIDILTALNDIGPGLVRVALSITTLDRRLARTMEPRAATPARRFDAIRQLSDAGIDTSVMVAPVIPGLTDMELEAILTAARDAGARAAGYIMLRLPLEVKGLFNDWLSESVPNRAGRVMRHVRSMRGGRANDPRFGHRMKGSGPYATLIADRFRLTCRRLGLETETTRFDTTRFLRPVADSRQLSLL